jgi:endonuclease/exonuclease/phosphatase family metal-dependent hydrolase
MTGGQRSVRRKGNPHGSDGDLAAVMDPPSADRALAAGRVLDKTSARSENRRVFNRLRFPDLTVGRLKEVVVAFVLAIALQSHSAGTNTDGAICVMTYNLRYASATPPNAWPQRRPLMRECLQKISPDIIGTQEGVYPQLKDLAEDLPDYSWIGTGRDGGSKGEFMAVYYRRSRFDPVAYDHFWLSDIPNVIGSTTWGNSNRRMVTMVRFLDRETKREFYLFNTHFDHQIQAAREKSAVLLRQRIQDLNTTLPVIVTGDFNAASDNKVHELLVADGFLSDTWDLARERRGEGLGTFNDFKGIPKADLRIDWILTRGKVKVHAEEIVTFSKDGQFPSDHFPLVAWLRLE